MNILYGVVGEGMGHATRSRVILEHLLERGHEVRVVVSGRAHGFLTDSFKDRSGITVQEIHGLHLHYKNNRVQISKSTVSNLAAAPKGLVKNIAAYQEVAESGFKPELVISDFESWAYTYARAHRIPVVSLDNMQIINRAQHDADLKKYDGYLRARTAVKIKLPGAYHYVITSFFFPPVRRKRTSLVPPILRPEILAAKREPGDHILVYQTAATNDALLGALKQLDYEFRVYGFRRDEDLGNVQLRDFSQEGFINDLRTAKAAISGGGFTLMGEAVHLGVPMLSIPVERQFEQVLNAQYLAKEGYGDWTESLDVDAMRSFLSRADEYSHNLERYPRQDNSLTFGVVDELIRLRGLDEPRPEKLDVATMGSYEPEPWDPDFDVDEVEVRDDEGLGDANNSPLKSR